MNIRNQYLNKPDNEHQVFNKPSLTVPEEARTIQEILASPMNMGPRENKYPYIDQQDLEKINHLFNPNALDLTDLERLASEVHEMRSIIADAKDKKDQIEEEKKILEQSDIKDHPDYEPPTESETDPEI